MTRLVVNIPLIETDRLTLRAPQESDLDTLTAFYATERSHMIGGPLDRPNCWRVISGGLGHWMLRGFGFWHIHHKADDRMIGATGFIFREGWSEPELGWNIHDGYEGKGFAYEAAKAARSYGAAKLGLDGVISYIAPDNLRSKALALRLGAQFESAGSLLGREAHIYRHPSQGSAA